MHQWIIYSVLTAFLISFEYITVKKAALRIPGLDMTTFSWQARLFSALTLTLILLWKIQRDTSQEDIIKEGSWKYAALTGVFMTLSVLAFYYALAAASNPGYPSAIKELSLVITLVMSAYFLGQPLKELHQMVWVGVALILGGACLIAKFSCR